MTPPTSRTPHLPTSFDIDPALLEPNDVLVEVLNHHPMRKGMSFATREEAGNFLRDQCAYSHTHFRTLMSNKERYEVICGFGGGDAAIRRDGKGCQWRCNFRWSTQPSRGRAIGEEDEWRWRITKTFHPEHTCAGRIVPPGSSQHDGSWIAQKVWTNKFQALSRLLDADHIVLLRWQPHRSPTKQSLASPPPKM